MMAEFSKSPEAQRMVIGLLAATLQFLPQLITWLGSTTVSVAAFGTTVANKAEQAIAAFNSIKTGAGVAFSIASAAVSSAATAMGVGGRSISATFTSAQASVTGSVRSLVSSVTSGFASVVSQALALPGRILGALAGVGARFYSVGTNIVDGIRSGILAAAGRLAATAADAVSNALSAAKKRLGIKSPSAVFHDEVGEQMMAGAEGGVEDGAQSLARTTASAMPGPSAVSVGSPSRQGGGVVVLRIDSAGSALDEVLVQVLRMAVSRAGGDVQLVLGSA
jgi:hypothetical protein